MMKPSGKIPVFVDTPSVTERLTAGMIGTRKVLQTISSAESAGSNALQLPTSSKKPAAPLQTPQPSKASSTSATGRLSRTTFKIAGGLQSKLSHRPAEPAATPKASRSSSDNGCPASARSASKITARTTRPSSREAENMPTTASASATAAPVAETLASSRPSVVVTPIVAGLPMVEPALVSSIEPVDIEASPPDALNASSSALNTSQDQTPSGSSFLSPQGTDSSAAPSSGSRPPSDQLKAFEDWRKMKRRLPARKMPLPAPSRAKDFAEDAEPQRPMPVEPLPAVDALFARWACSACGRTNTGFADRCGTSDCRAIRSGALPPASPRPSHVASSILSSPLPRSSSAAQPSMASVPSSSTDSPVSPHSQPSDEPAQVATPTQALTPTLKLTPTLIATPLQACTPLQAPVEPLPSNVHSSPEVATTAEASAPTNLPPPASSSISSSISSVAPVETAEMQIHDFSSIDFMDAREDSTTNSVLRHFVEMKDRKTGRQKTFHVLKSIGEGGSCKVFQVMDDRKDFYALKRVARDDHSESVYAREIGILQRPSLRDHSLIINLKGVGLSEKYIYLLLELGSADFKHVLERTKRELVSRLQIATCDHVSEVRDYLFQVRVFWQQILKAVQAAHEAGVIHCDLKPANFLNVGGVLKLIDFGISRELVNEHTHIFCDARKIQGSLSYIPPENFYVTEGAVTLRTSADVWSLGCMLYQMVYGTTPFHGANMNEVTLKLKRRVPIDYPRQHCQIPAMAIPGTVITVLKRCLNYNASERPTIQDLIRASFEL